MEGLLDTSALSNCLLLLAVHYTHTGFHLENCPRWGGGGNWRNLDFKEGMMVKDVTKFCKCHLGGRGMLDYVYVCVCLCWVSYRILSLGGGKSKVWC